MQVWQLPTEFPSETEEPTTQAKTECLASVETRARLTCMAVTGQYVLPFEDVNAGVKPTKKEKGQDAGDSKEAGDDQAGVEDDVDDVDEGDANTNKKTGKQIKGKGKVEAADDHDDRKDGKKAAATKRKPTGGADDAGFKAKRTGEQGRNSGKQAAAATPTFKAVKASAVSVVAPEAPRGLEEDDENIVHHIINRSQNTIVREQRKRRKIKARKVARAAAHQRNDDRLASGM